MLASIICSDLRLRCPVGHVGLILHKLDEKKFKIFFQVQNFLRGSKRSLQTMKNNYLHSAFYAV